MYKKNYKSARIRGKLRVCQYLSANRALKANVPHTALLTPANLKSMSAKYKSVYIKLDVGSLGIGVYKLNRTTGGFELYATSNRKQRRKLFHSLTGVLKHLRSEQRGKRMIIQKAVALDLVNGRPYDIRAMVQRKPGGSWICTGMVAKVGRPQKIVTNYHQGGEVYTMVRLLKEQRYSPASIRSRMQALSAKSVSIARCLNKKRSGMHEMGIDFAYDRHKKDQLWVLEVNSNHPQFSPLKRIDPPTYKRIAAFAKAYGRRDD